jgi:hypothetical protein
LTNPADGPAVGLGKEAEVMDPISVILTALATAGGKVAGQAVSDAYAGLKRLILTKFGAADPQLEQRLEQYVADQESNERPAAEALQEVGAGGDQEVVDRAVEVLREAEAAQPGVTGGLVGKIDAAGGKVVVVGHVHGDFTMN